MDRKHVEGENKGDVLLYALSTCVWCGKTKKLLNQMGVEYSFVDVDLLGEKEKSEAMEDIKRFNPECSFPTMVVNNKICIVGYDIEKIEETLSQ